MPSDKSALQKLLAIENAARAFGFEWPDHNMVIDQAISESEEVREAIELGESAARIQEEIGDLIHTAISLCVFEGFDVEQTMQRAADKFTVRMRAMQKLAAEHGLQSVHGQSLDFQMQLWGQAKESCGS